MLFLLLGRIFQALTEIKIWRNFMLREVLDKKVSSTKYLWDVDMPTQQAVKNDK